jgi:pimeloyl-ACP methyl ester carboxylesterase
MTAITAHHGLFSDTHLYVDDTGGSGRPVVLIHGWPLSSESWKLQTPALQAAGYRVVAYDRRGFGRSDKPLTGYTYNSLAGDLHTLLVELDLNDVTLVGFSMGGGEVARYFTEFGDERLHSVVFASAVPPYMMHTDDNPDGPLTPEDAGRMAGALTADEDKFYDEFMTQFFSAHGKPTVSEEQRQEALGLCKQAAKPAALECMAAFGMTDFRDDLRKVTVPTLVLHGDADATVPFESAGKLTHEIVADSELRVISDAPHGCNVSHPEQWNRALIDFLGR